MEMKKKILMVGIGLIGSSIALAIKESASQVHIMGYSLNEDELVGAKSKGIIEEICLDFKEAAKKADIIFLCTPVSATIQLMDRLSMLSLKEKVLITDVGSTKKEIIKHAKVLLDKGYMFIGGHPMAGSHKSGFLAGSKDLFENAYYILVPTGSESDEHMLQLKTLLKGTRAKFMILDACEHDKITGVLSHMPHIIAAQLVTQADEMMADFPEARKLAAGGFRDITRIASSNPLMWADISKSNSLLLEQEIDQWLINLSEFKKLLQTADKKLLFHYFDKAKKIRDDIPVHQEGSIPAFHDLYINVPDYPGAIAEVTAILAAESISLINIKIMETRDDIFGVLRISFKNETDLYQAKNLITSRTSYETIIN